MSKSNSKPTESKRVKVVGILKSGAWHSGGKIKYGHECDVSAQDAKILFDHDQVAKPDSKAADKAVKDADV